MILQCSKCSTNIPHTSGCCPTCSHGKPFAGIKLQPYETKGWSSAEFKTFAAAGGQATSPGSKWAMWLILALIVAGWLIAGEASKTPEDRAAEREAEKQEQAAKRAENEQEKRKGFHCLSSWDGSQRFVVQQVKSRLNDPDSFEHVSTRVAPENEGLHAVIMEYRAKNAFGGLILSTAVGTFRNSDCSSVSIAQYQ